MLFFHEELNEFGKEEPHGPVYLYTAKTQAPVFPPDMILKSQEFEKKIFVSRKSLKSKVTSVVRIIASELRQLSGN